MESGAPPNSSFNSTTGVFTWTPTEAQGPSTNFVVIRVTDNGNPPASDVQTVTIIVNEVNLAPSLPALQDRTVNELSLLVVTNAATDGDLPANKLTYLFLSAPAGASIDSSGIINWTPPEGFFPTTNKFTVKVTDDGTPAKSATNSFQVVVNHLPVPASPVVQRLATKQLKVLRADLVGTEPDGDPVTITSFDSLSDKGVPITTDGTWIYYNPTLPFTLGDSFDYVLNDGRGGSSTGTVSVVVATDTVANADYSITDLGNGSFLVRFSGVPGYSYRIEAATNPANPIWQTIATVTADSGGAVLAVDAPTGGTPRTYQMKTEQQ